MSLYSIISARFKGDTLAEVRMGEGSPAGPWIRPPLYTTVAKVLGKLDEGHTVATCFPSTEGADYVDGPSIKAVAAPGGGRTLGIKPRYGDQGLKLEDLPSLTDDWRDAVSAEYGGYRVRFMVTRRPLGGLVLYRTDITPASAGAPELPPDTNTTGTEFARGTDAEIWAAVLERARHTIDALRGSAH